jgi:hypothetical protein
LSGQSKTILTFFVKKFHRGNSTNGGLVVPRSKRGAGQHRRKPAVLRANLICLDVLNKVDMPATAVRPAGFVRRSEGE